jgi:predicted nucleic acid-binding protein
LIAATPRERPWGDGRRHGSVRNDFLNIPPYRAFHDIPVAGIIGHRQVTDAYLAHLARSYSARLATFDQALAKLHADVADLIPGG